MRFELVDRVVERGETRIVAVKQVTSAEEYLRDHFPTFPVLPGVLMLEAMVQAARRLMEGREAGSSRWVLGRVRGLKYGAMVRPGDALRVEVEVVDGPTGEGAEFRGTGTVVMGGGGERTAVSGKFALRPVRV